MKDLEQHIEACKRGDERSRRRLYDAYRNYAMHTVFRFIYRYDRAEDVVTDGFVKVFRNMQQVEWREGVDNERLFMGWMKRIMVNTAIDELRRQKMIPEIGGVPHDCWDLSSDERADGKLLYNDLIQALRSLPPLYRTVFNLHVIDGYSHTEIAEQLNIAVGTSKSTLSRARQLLQTRIELLEKPLYAASR